LAITSKLVTKEAEEFDIILACDGAASVGQVGHEIAVRLTQEVEGARMCCLSAVAAESKPHVGIAKRAKKLILINGCQNQCASKILKRLKINPSYEITIAKEGVDKKPTLDFDEDDVERISKKIAEEVSKLPERERAK